MFLITGEAMKANDTLKLSSGCIDVMLFAPIQKGLKERFVGGGERGGTAQHATIGTTVIDFIRFLEILHDMALCLPHIEHLLQLHQSYSHENESEGSGMLSYKA
jgi:hypothetical protein